MFKKLFRKITMQRIDVTIDSIGIIDNKLPICNFFDNVLMGKNDSINVLYYGIEGELYYRIISYKDGIITMTTYQNNKLFNEFKGNRYMKEKRGDRINYSLYNNDRFMDLMIWYKN